MQISWTAKNYIILCTILIIIIIPRIIFIVLSSWPQGHCESSLSSDQAIWLGQGYESACRLLSSTTTIAIYYYYSARKADTHLPSHGVEGWVDLGTAGKVCTARAQGCKSRFDHRTSRTAVSQITAACEMTNHLAYISHISVTFDPENWLKFFNNF